jgi:hypothetical protein
VLPETTLYRVLARSIACGFVAGEVLWRSGYRVFQNATTRWAVEGIRRM